MFSLRFCLIALAITSVAVQVAAKLTCAYCLTEKNCKETANPSSVTCDSGSNLLNCVTVRLADGTPIFRNCATDDFCSNIGIPNVQCITCKTDFCNK